MKLAKAVQQRGVRLNKMMIQKRITRILSKALIYSAAVLLVFSSFSISLTVNHGSAYAAPICKTCCKCGCTCKPKVTNCSVTACQCQSDSDTPITIKHVTDEFIKHREWLMKILWEAHVLPAMMLMTEQITAFSMQQMLMVGSLFDAKHQLETQQLLEQMQAQAHKDYHPSEGMCRFGSTSKSLAASDRNADFTQTAIATRAMQRNLLNGNTISAGDQRDESRSRFNQFKKTYCNPLDFGNGMDLVCNGSDPKRYNKDVNYTQTIDSNLTLEIDLTESASTPDEEDVFALATNLYGHKTFPYIPEWHFDKKHGNRIATATNVFMKMRSLTAKRSVAEAAFAAQAGMRSQGEKDVFPYMEAFFKEMGLEDDQIKQILSERPSYHAQMEMLSKTLYQTPNFYTELYDKPTNIDRKNVAMQAIGSIQRRDMYLSQLRSEAIAAVWLETAIKDIEELYVNESNPMKANSKPLNLPGLN